MISLLAPIHMKLIPMKNYDDGAFSIEDGTWGFQSYTKDGEKAIFSQSEEDCVFWTRLWLKARQEGGWPESRVVNSGVVGGKL